jgi:hypothetical protein
MLSDRQFVVDKTKLSIAEYKLQRELFWYREELFKSVRGHWREVCRHFPSSDVFLFNIFWRHRWVGLGRGNYH